MVATSNDLFYFFSTFSHSENCMLFMWGSSSRHPKITKLCPFLFIPHACPAFNIYHVYTRSWHRVPNTLFYEDPFYIAYPPFKFCPASFPTPAVFYATRPAYWGPSDDKTAYGGQASRLTHPYEYILLCSVSNYLYYIE